tara:strand:- start:1049 stop:3796 length:2748 start_codon:yes stop_codon:yes gene_type:complete
MAHKFDKTKATNIGTIFPSSGEPNNFRTYEVPEFQRNFSWAKDKAEQFWYDILEQADDFIRETASAAGGAGQIDAGQYLIGPNVLVPQNANDDLEDNEKKKFIIDGQQRFATITIIFCVIRDLIYELYGANGTGSSIALLDLRRRIANIDGSDTWKNWKLTLNTKDEKFFRIIQDEFVNSTQGQVEGNILTYEEKLKKFDEKIRAVYEDETAERSVLKLKTVYETIHELISEGLFLNFDKSKDFKEETKDFRAAKEIEVDADVKNKSTLARLGIEECLWENINKLEIYKIGVPTDGLEDKDGNMADAQTEKTNLQTAFSKAKKNKLDANGNPIQDSTGKNLKEPKFATFEEFIDNEITNLKKGVGKRSIKKNNLFKLQAEEVKRVIEKETVEQRKTGMEKLSKILLNFTTNLYFVKVTIKEEDDAFQIFETLNERGEPLDKSNLIKTHLLKTLKENTEGWSDTELETQYEDLNKKWDDIFKNISQPDDSFIAESLRTREPFDKFKINDRGDEVDVTKSNLFKVIKYDKIGLKPHEPHRSQKAIDYIDNELRPDADFCMKLNSPHELYPDNNQTHQQRCPERQAILGINAIGAKYVRLPIITAQRKWAPTLGLNGTAEPRLEDYQTLVRFLFRFFFRYKSVRNESQQALQKYVIEVCKQIEKDEPIENIMKYLLQYNNEKSFRDELQYFTQGRAKKFSSLTARFVLQEINSSMDTTYGDMKPVDGLTLEHVLPQDTKKWNKDDFFDGYAGSSDKYFNKFTWNLGNLTILTGTVNTKISNEKFLEKRDHKDKDDNEDGYNSSDLKINQFLKSLTEWKATNVEEQEIQYRGKIIEIFEMPRLRCSKTSCEGNKIFEEDSNHDVKKITEDGVMIKKITDAQKKIEDNFHDDDYEKVNEIKCPICSDGDLKLELPDNMKV